MARALLMIADIGGYTRFMKVHRINLAHAQYVVAQLLEAVLDAAGKRLKLAKLEGDAAFFYATLPDKGDVDLGTLGKSLTDIRGAFAARRDELAMDRVCSCDGCTQAGDLKLKFVTHFGEIAFQKVKRYKEIAGLDVIFVHRLLKNSVPLAEYVLMSEPVHDRAEDALRENAKALDEHLEGLGDARTFYVDLNTVVPLQVTPRAPSFLRRLWGWLKMTWRSLPYFVGARKACDGFRNMTEVTSLPPPSMDLPESSRRFGP
jgi:hypothetical protein